MTLDVCAPEFASFLALPPGFDTLCHHPHIEVARQIGDSANNGSKLASIRQPCNEPLIDFNFIEWETE